jgi:hypothetical protein
MNPDLGRTDADLARAYEATAYRVELPSGSVVVRLGAICGPLERLLRDEHLDSWAFLSAANPRSVALPPACNGARHALLLRDLASMGLPYFPGSGEPDEPGWEAEISVLVLGIGVDGAVELGRRFGQKAIVFGRLGTPAALVWC